MKKILFSLLFCSLLWANKQYFSLQFMGLTYHPSGGIFTELYPRAFDDEAYFVANIGAVAKYDIYLDNKWFIRSLVSLYKDCADVLAGHLHIGIRREFLNIGKHSFNLGLGPTFLFRQDWHRFEQYNDDIFFGDRVSGDYQYRFLLYGGEIEYNYQINDNIDFQYSIIPGFPSVVIHTFGIRVKIK